MFQPKQTTRLTLNYRVLCALLVLVIVGMLALWQPWEAAKTSDRTVEVTGQVTLREAPDEFVFTPSYQFENANKQEALQALSKKSDEIISRLKQLGVDEKNIKTNASGHDTPTFRPDSQVPSYTLRLTITVGNKELAQKVQDYLVTTTPVGSVSPQANFSEAKRKEVENQARDEATKDARRRADRSAQNLGFRLGSVKSVNDGVGFGGIISPVTGLSEAADTTGRLTVQPGENELTYTVRVTFFIK